MLLMTLAVILAAPGGAGQSLQPVDNDQEMYYSDRGRVDRYMDVEVWTNHADGEYYVGDDIAIHFRSSRDAFVAIYSVDSRGRVNLLFPSTAGEDNFVLGGETYRIPGDNWDYDLEVSGPDGIENIQIIASRERFPIPNWYRNSGLVCDWDDRYEFMDYLNGKYFVRYEGQRFAYDRSVIFVNEWEPTYYRPIYRPYYPSWSVCGNAYIDYGWGNSVYVNGVYWGCTPLYLPRVAVGWHTVTIYDPHGYCWESDIQFSHYNTVILNRTVINPSPTVKSKYKEVRTAGYREPASAGYTNFKPQSSSVIGSKSSGGSNGKSTVITKNSSADNGVGNYKYSRGSTTLIKTTRGFETDHSISSAKQDSRAARTTNGPAGYDRYKSRKEGSSSKGTVTSGGTTSGSSAGQYQKRSGSSATRSTGSSSGTYKGTSSSGSSSGKGTVKSSGGSSKAPSGKKSGTVKKTSNGGKSSGSSGKVKSSGGDSKSSSGAKKSSNGASKNSGGKSSKSSSSSKAKGKG